jgi:hypothetical protein
LEAKLKSTNEKIATSSTTSDALMTMILMLQSEAASTARPKKQP